MSELGKVFLGASLFLMATGTVMSVGFNVFTPYTFPVVVFGLFAGWGFFGFIRCVLDPSSYTAVTKI